MVAFFPPLLSKSRMGAAMTKEREEEQGFRVTDKRGFREDGEARTPESSEKTEEKPESEPASAAAGQIPSDKQTATSPPVDFPSYILFYYTQGMVLLGEVPDPHTNQKHEDMEAARHIIDILSMLEQKTKGNLTKEEEQLLEGVLYELRMRFMAKTNRIKY